MMLVNKFGLKHKTTCKGGNIFEWIWYWENHKVGHRKHYSQLQSYVDNAISDSTQAEDIWLNELLADMFDDNSIVRVNAIVKSKEKTALMMRHVNNMLDIYAEKCNTKQFKYCECMRRYYINGETLEQIAESFPEKPDVRTIKRYIARGIEELSVLLWGVIGLNTKIAW